MTPNNVQIQALMPDVGCGGNQPSAPRQGVSTKKCRTLRRTQNVTQTVKVGWLRQQSWRCQTCAPRGIPPGKI